MKYDALFALAELVRIQSVSGDEASAADWTVAWCVAQKLDVERIGNSVIARVTRGRGPRLLLHSHLDTVPVGEGWTRDPYAATWEDGKLVGRGANDAKASVVAMLCSLVEFAERSDAVGEALVALTACEETTNAGMADVLARLGPPDGGFCGEPTGLEVVRAQSGLAVLIAEWHGRSCHAAHVARVPHENALHAACRELASTAPYLTLAGEHPLLGKSTTVSTVLRAGERSNVVPDRAEAIFDARLSPLHRASDVVNLLAEKLPTANLRVRSERLKPVETPADHPLVRAALLAAGKPRAIGSNTMSDMALLAGVPAVKVGPGETARSHTPNEFVLASEVEAGVRFYSRALPLALEALAAQGVGA
ncbi:MAG: M20/M25/M40 family metallo-hydrolase [Planctomycetes bacterium]|nr:M20/M25/M40 family metallo-hydrolase [Planctomycetota bacterium]